MSHNMTVCRDLNHIEIEIPGPWWNHPSAARTRYSLHVVSPSGYVHRKRS